MMKKRSEMMDILFIAMVKRSAMIGNIETDIFQIAGCSLIHWDNTKENLRKDCIQIAIQCDSTETGIAVGWHEDWLVEAKENRSLQ